MNSVTLTGRLTRDPELQERGGKTVCDMRLAVDDGARSPVYVDVIAFEAQAIACAEHLAKGRQVGVQGRLHYAEWETDEGGKRSRHSVIGRVEFLDSKPNAELDRTGAAAPTNGDENP